MVFSDDTIPKIDDAAFATDNYKYFQYPRTWWTSAGILVMDLVGRAVKFEERLFRKEYEFYRNKEVLQERPPLTHSLYGTIVAAPSPTEITVLHVPLGNTLDTKPPYYRPGYERTYHRDSPHITYGTHFTATKSLYEHVAEDNAEAATDKDETALKNSAKNGTTEVGAATWTPWPPADAEVPAAVVRAQTNRMAIMQDDETPRAASLRNRDIDRRGPRTIEKLRDMLARARQYAADRLAEAAAGGGRLATISERLDLRFLAQEQSPKQVAPRDHSRHP